MANYYEFVFSNIENAYVKYRKLLLENDTYRPCKSITRDIFASIDKFRAYYTNKKLSKLSIEDILECLDNATEVNDTVNTNIRVMRELKLLIVNGSEYVFTKSFIELANSTKSSASFFLDKLKSCKKLSDFCMVFNTVICALREGYLTSRIISFAEGVNEFKLDVPSKAKRLEYCQMVYDIYGFRGRNKSIESDEYTPNCNYRILTVLKNPILNLVTLGPKVDNMNTYVLTKEAFELLTVINRNFEDIFFSLIESKSDDELNAVRKTGGTNVILYGVPGAGKSWTIENEYMDNNTKIERLVFHPDYTYSDFVGQILPKKKGDDISYDFISGPFTKIMRDAYRNPEIKYILAIEEINRGNAPAIFGDIFQLLDRDKLGYSSYDIINADIAREVYGDENHPVKIPSNLTLLCTMNTSDQNVFTLDTAFQRRWNMRLIENSFRKDTQEEKDFAAKTILDTSIKWEAFCVAINNQILEKNQNMTSSEDKRLGTHFVSLDDLTMRDENSIADGKENKLKNRRFPEKVIKYLWDDAFKFYRDEIFKEELNSLEKVISVFATKTKDDRFDIFKDNIKSAIFDENKK